MTGVQTCALPISDRCRTVWRASQSYNGRMPLQGWLKKKAKGRMLDAVRNWSSGPGTLNVSAGHPDVDDPGLLWDSLTAELPALEMAYHRGEINTALNALTPREREYVHLRFWRGYRNPQMIAHFGYEPHALWGTARPKLAGRLAHLASAT